ncbi:hypothetical protein MNEG_3823 [Monoraphidium neglectum]|uniref:Uncharacterized protein n=1 Tax=Monoraphidium neglectum TaxID=145388 RepID=A0A0D2MN39_9CHLO|nr:hypothetical protein MNEG_3823 [Monoraphidium neglectum]KIZ04135.1 hypothetical protein MNEG_3823 [Monoraphidium neglectum]|eukprot:XP_013903154.1 hypothetical protein MNEG_3823 [Monoraphidium neglectum]
MNTTLDVSRTQLLVAAVLLVLAAPAPLRGVAAQPGPPGGAPPGRSIVDEVPADENGHRKLWMNWLCTRDNPLSDAGCRNLTLGQLEAWEGGLPKGIDLVTRDAGPGASDASQRDNGQPFSDGGPRLLAQQGAGRAPSGPRRGLLAVTNWNFPADITTCVQGRQGRNCLSPKTSA